MATDAFTTVRSTGGLLPSDLLKRVAALDRNLPAVTATDYHLAANERIRDAIARSWTRLQGAWQGFETERAKLPETDRGTTVTRERWLQVLFQELGFGRLPTTTAITVDGTVYPVSHGWGQVPIHLVSWKVGLDERVQGVAGAARWTPHAMVQELLNRSDEHLWAFVANGERLRVLRDNRSLTRQAYVEFDLASMMAGEVYSDFVVLWLVCHQSRVEADRPELFVLEQWVETARQDGTRVLDTLRDGVEQALTTLGTGLLAHPANTALRAAIDDGEVTPTDLYRELLRVVYRLLFLFVAEDRDLLLTPPDQSKPDARQRYTDFYSTARLRQLARYQVGGPHGDLWQQLVLVFGLLGSDTGEEGLALPPLGGGLWDAASTATVVATPDQPTELANRDLLEVLRRLAWTHRDRLVRPVDYRNLGAEELGSVYEALLELHPEVSTANRTFALTPGAGNERKTTGSYYTPTALINQLLDTALDPVIDDAIAADDPEAALLDISVCDPACGSGHFLVAAAHRLAARMAVVRTGESEPALGAVQDAMRDVVSRCIYGVDVNPMAVELAKVSLWLEAHVPGKPLTFLDHHVKHGNALLGTTPAMVRRGVPDDAFKPIEGDDKKVAREFRKANKLLRGGQQDLLTLAAEAEGRYDVLSVAAEAVTELADDDIESLHAKEAAHGDFEQSEALRRARLTADAWCATFTFPKVKGEADDRDQHPHELFYELRDGTAPSVSPAQQVVADQQSTYDFFHWHLEFPHLFELHDQPAADDPLGWSGGFSVILGNPPWIAHAGRAAQPIRPALKQIYGFLNPAFAGYRTTHGMFVGWLPRLIRIFGRLGLVLPTSVADLQGYGPSRKAHDRYAKVVEPLTNFGDGAFEGVFQPCMALVSIRVPKQTLGSADESLVGEIWTLDRDDLDPLDRQILQRCALFTALPPHWFGERGHQTSAQERAELVERSELRDGYDWILEGKDVEAFRISAPRLQFPSSLLGGRGQQQRETTIVIRQTARFPIAARHIGVNFRNSLLACDPDEEIDADAVVGLLNSSLIRWLHYQRFRDAREGMPQVKISHLRQTPAPARLDSQLVEEVSAASRHLASDPATQKQLCIEIDRAVFDLYEIPEKWRRHIVEKVSSIR